MSNGKLITKLTNFDQLTLNDKQFIPILDEIFNITVVYQIVDHVAFNLSIQKYWSKLKQFAYTNHVKLDRPDKLQTILNGYAIRHGTKFMAGLQKTHVDIDHPW